MPKYSEATKAKALAALEGMRQIVRREMLITGTYVDDEVSNPSLTGAICGGRKHCAIGSLWAGGGVKPDITIHPRWGWESISLPGVSQEQRPEFLRHRPGLRLAYDSLNAAAEAFATKHDLDLEAGSFDAAIEGLFEGHYGDRLTKRDLLAIVSAAKRTVAKA